MESKEIKRLIEKAVPSGNPSSIWADLGSGDGAFTLALYELLIERGSLPKKIYSVDRDGSRLNTQKLIFEDLFPDADIEFIAEDFTEVTGLPPLDGILMANALHFVKEKMPLLVKLKTMLKPGGKLVLVEYDTDRENPYVPYPISFKALAPAIAATGLTKPILLATAPSQYQGRMYAAEIGV